MTPTPDPAASARDALATNEEKLLRFARSIGGAPIDMSPVDAVDRLLATIDAIRADNERLREAAQAVVDAQPTDWGHQEDEVSVEVELREPVFDRLMDAIDALRAPLAPAAPTPGEEPSDG